MRIASGKHAGGLPMDTPGIRGYTGWIMTADDSVHVPLSLDPGRVAQLARSAREGNRYAFEQLADMYSRKVFRMVYSRTRSRMDAEDITQEVFLKAFVKIPGLKDPERFGTWLFTIARNRVLDHMRRKRLKNLIFKEPDPEMPNDGMDSLAHDNPGALEEVMRRDFWMRVEKFSVKLSRWEREVFYLRFMDHLGIREISEVIQKNESTVKTHLYRALAKFKKENALLGLLREGMS